MIKQTSNPTPDMEKIKELTFFIKRPLGGQVVLFNPVAPMVSAGGVVSNEEIQHKLQNEINKKGLLVIQAPEDCEVKVGERVLINKHAEATVERTINTTDLVEGLNEGIITEWAKPDGKYSHLNEKAKIAYYKRYVLLIIHPINLAAVVE